MFSLNTRKSKSGRSVARTALATLLCLASAFLFLACPTGGGGDGSGVAYTPPPTLNGTWSSQWGDGYTITDTTLTYDMSGWGYGGTIGTTTKFDDTAGVIIFRYTQAPTGMDADETAAIEKHVMGKYTAVYYKSLTANSVQMSTVSQYDQQDPNNLDKTYPIANSLGAARIKFTADKTGDFISLWGDYTK